MTSDCVVRPMQDTDLKSVLMIQDASYTDPPPETAGSVITKHAASPSTCFVACQNDLVVGYLLAVPCRFESPPGLNEEISGVPSDADTLYLHDLAVAPAARGCGAGSALVKRFLQLVPKLKYPHATLISVQNSSPYWERHGFRPAQCTPRLEAKLASYGSGALYMQLAI